MGTVFLVICLIMLSVVAVGIGILHFRSKANERAGSANNQLQVKDVALS